MHLEAKYVRNYQLICLFSGVVYSIEGPVRGEGRVQVCWDGECGSVCDYGWNSPDTRVLCKQMGFLDGSPLV